MTTKRTKSETTETATAQSAQTPNFTMETFASESVERTVDAGLDEIISGVRKLTANLEQDRRDFQIKPWHMLVAFGLGAWAAAVGAQAVTRALEQEKEAA